MTTTERDLDRALAGELPLALFLGAGVSADSGLPSWQQLVASVYMAGLSADSPGGAIRHAYRNYLRAIADSQEETSRCRSPSIKRASYDMLREILYASMMRIKARQEQVHAALEQNCCSDLCTKRHVDRVITYNYDDLLEIELKRRGFSASPVWQPKQRPKETTRLPRTR